MRTITFEHRTNEWYDGDNPNEWDNYDSNQVTIDVTDGNWWEAVDSFIRFLNTSGFKEQVRNGSKPISYDDIISYLGGITKKDVDENYTRKPFVLSPGVSVMEYDG